MISTLVGLLERTGFWHWSFSPLNLNHWLCWYHITYVPLVVAGGANSTVQTRETYDPTYCSVKLPGPQPLAPMDAETAERYVAVMTFYRCHFFHCPQCCHFFCSSHHTFFIPIFAPCFLHYPCLSFHLVILALFLQNMILFTNSVIKKSRTYAWHICRTGNIKVSSHLFVLRFVDSVSVESFEFYLHSVLKETSDILDVVLTSHSTAFSILDDLLTSLSSVFSILDVILTSYSGFLCFS